MSIKRVSKSGIKSETSPQGYRSLTQTSGLPSPVQNVSSSVNDVVNVILSWSAPAISEAGAVTGYSIVVTPGGGSASVVGTSASVTNLSPATSYNFDVIAENSLGKGSSNRRSNTTGSFNAATGGTETTVSNYNGSGQTWKTHRFNSTSTLSVTTASTTFRTLVVGGGGGGNGGGPYCIAGTAGTHGQAKDQLVTISTGSNSVTVGGGGGTSNFGGVTSTGAGGGARISSDITGSAVTYAAGNGGTGGCGCPGSNGGPGGFPGGAGGGGGGGGNCPPFTPGGGGPGAAGQVFVAYRTA